MLPMPIADHDAIIKELSNTGRYVKVLWQSDDTLMFIARGRAYRSAFHINPSDEHMTMLKGNMNHIFERQRAAKMLRFLGKVRRFIQRTVFRTRHAFLKTHLS